MTTRTILVAGLLAGILALAACSPGSVSDELRLVEVVDGRAYLCLTDAINDSLPPSCGGASIGSERNPELTGDEVPDLVAALGSRTGFARITARDDGQWVLERFEVPKEQASG